jgi:2-polyprenyl-3-methyl-5-hydroxy-6-metoxy-1,4-benzoquinol methylase
MRMNEDILVKEVPYCMLCGNQGKPVYQVLRDRLYGSPGIWELLRCPRCELVWLNPRPVSTDIGKLYTQYFTHNKGSSIPRLPGFAKMIENAILEARLNYKGLVNKPWGKSIGKVFSLIKSVRETVELSVMNLEASEKERLLDIGCGCGEFLARMRDLGWETTGLDPDREAVKVAREHFGLIVHEGTLENLDFQEESFQAITMNHVIEHVDDPIESLKKCRLLLKRNGKLVIVTPNMEGLGSQLFKKAWFPLDPPRHFYLFSVSTLSACAERAELRILAVKTTARAARAVWAASRLIRRNGALPDGASARRGLWSRLEGIIFHAVEDGLTLTKDVGEEVVLVATK